MKTNTYEIKRCEWCGDDELYVRYHDEEWGRPVSDNKRLFEFLILEGAQAGLSWITVLRKREGYRKAFHDFNFREVARMTLEDERQLWTYDGIVKNKRKIHSAVENARLFGNIVDEFGSFDSYILSFFPEGKRIVNDVPNIDAVHISSHISDAISKDMYKRGFRFFGSVICYSFLQATGYIDDHINDCHCKSGIP